MTDPSWAVKCREWRTGFEVHLEPHYRDKAANIAIIHSFREDMGLDAGKYIYTPFLFHEIRLSCFMTEEEARSTYGHEYAHFLAVLFYGYNGHGFLWRSFMVLFDLPAEEFHKYPIASRCIIEQIVGKLKGLPYAGDMGDQKV
jgi:hypothetical protein